jgi:hypothetical protein
MPAPSPQTFGHLQQLASYELPHLFSRRTAAFPSEPAHGVWILLKIDRHRTSAEMAGNGNSAAADQDLSTIIEYLSGFLLWCLGHGTLCVARPETRLSRVRRTNE